MESTFDGLLQRQSSPPLRGAQALIIPVSLVIHCVLIVVCVALSINVLELDTRSPVAEVSFLRDAASSIGSITGVEVGDFGRLGQPVQDFVGLLLLVPVGLAIFSIIRLLQRRPAGRYSALVLQYLGFVLSLIALLQISNFFLSFERIVDGIMRNPGILYMLPIAYGIYLVSDRMDVTNPWKDRLARAALALVSIAIVALVLYSDILGATTIIRITGSRGAWLAIAGMLVFGFLAYHMLHMGDHFGESTQGRDAWQGWLMLSPNIIGFSLFFAGPLLLSFYLSFTNSSVGRIPEFNGLKNYGEILALDITWQGDARNAQSALDFGYSVLTTVKIGGRTLVIGAKDTLFWRSLGNTLFFCMLLIPLSIIPALILAMILNSKLPGVKFFRAVYFLPSVAAVVGTALIWRWLYDPTIGYFNYAILEIVNFLNSIFGLSIATPSVRWLTDPSTVMFSMVLVAAWGLIGFNTVLFLAGLQGIPKTLYEAATVDGANRWAQFRNVTLPMLWPTTFFVIITTMIQGLQEFNLPYALFPSRPIPVDVTTSVYYLYNRGFTRFEFGYASSIAWLLFALIFLITLAQFRLQRSNAYE